MELNKELTIKINRIRDLSFKLVDIKNLSENFKGLGTDVDFVRKLEEKC